jgi:hypothetical protein
MEDLMRRPVLASALATIALLAGSATADAASFAGKWTAKFSPALTLQLTLKGSGANYKGTYSTITTIKNKNKSTTKTISQPVLARTMNAQKVPTLMVTITETQAQQPKGVPSQGRKPSVTFYCTLKSQQLSCKSRVTGKNIVFSLSK